MKKREFSGQVAIVTGAASGLGRRLCLDLDQAGMRLVMADRDRTGLESLAAECPSVREDWGVHPTDVTDATACRRLVEATIERFGRIDYLVLCAGVSMWARFEEVTDLTVFRTLVEVNYLGAVHCIHPSLPFLRQSRGKIVAISSLQGELSIPNHTGYSAAKHALNGFLESLEYELGVEGPRILTVMPGWITGTKLRENAITHGRMQRGSPRKHSKEAVSVEECSRLIVHAMRSDVSRLYIPSKLKFLPWLKLIAPGYVRGLIRRAVEEQRAE